MKILAIESSCDDTAVSVTEDFNIISNIVSSQTEIHRKWGGVYPIMAKREHKKNLISVTKKSLKEANILKKEKNILSNKKVKTIEKFYGKDKDFLKNVLKFLGNYKKPGLDAIAITYGPGLEPCLWVGVNFAKALSIYWDLPIIPVNHIEAHILINIINFKEKEKKDIFPAICLVVSGGHTQIIFSKKIGDYRIIGETRDDAAGECFDKTARIIGLDYPGGPNIEKEALIFRTKYGKLKGNIKLPRPMINTKDYDFSFSGLKTAVLYKVEKDGKKSETIKYKREMANEIEQSIIDVLIKKTLMAAKDFNVKSIIIGGGVSANKEFKKQIRKKAENLKVIFPDKKLSGDNAAMIGITALFNKKKDWKKLKANANLRI